MANPWWVGAYIEAGMGVGGSSGTPYLPFVFQDATKAQAQKDAAAKLLSGPYSTQAAAQAWADAYEKNPKTIHAGSDIPSGPGNPVPLAGSGPGGTGTVQGDNPPGPAGWAQALATFLGNLTNANTWIRVAEAALGLVLIAVGVGRITGASKVLGGAVKLAAA